MPLGENLVKNGFISQAQLEKALQEQAKNPSEKIGQVIIRLGMATTEQVEKSL